MAEKKPRAGSQGPGQIGFHQAELEEDLLALRSCMPPQVTVREWGRPNAQVAQRRFLFLPFSCQGICFRRRTLIVATTQDRGEDVGEDVGGRRRMPVLARLLTRRAGAEPRTPWSAPRPSVESNATSGAYWTQLTIPGTKSPRRFDQQSRPLRPVRPEWRWRAATPPRQREAACSTQPQSSTQRTRTQPPECEPGHQTEEQALSTKTAYHDDATPPRCYPNPAKTTLTNRLGLGACPDPAQRDRWARFMVVAERGRPPSFRNGSIQKRRHGPGCGRDPALLGAARGLP